MLTMMMLALAVQDVPPATTPLGRAIAAGTATDCAATPEVAECRRDPGDRFRIADVNEPMPDAKARAFATDGGECNLVGAKMCTSDGIPFVRRSLSQEPR